MSHQSHWTCDGDGMCSATSADGRGWYTIKHSDTGFACLVIQDGCESGAQHACSIECCIIVVGDMLRERNKGRGAKSLERMPAEGDK